MTAALPLLLALVVAACGGNEVSPTPAAETSPGTPPQSSAAPKTVPAAPAPATLSATPSPAVDVVAAFRTEMASRQELEADIDGTVTVGATTVPVEGSLLSRGSDSRQTFTINAGGKAQTTETINLAGTTYTRRGEVWFGAPTKTSAAAGSMDAAFRQSMAGLTDLGPVTVDGRTLHRIAPPSGTTVPMSAFGAASPGSSDGDMTIEFYTEPDGTPAIITLDATWTERVGKADQSASMHLDFAVRDGSSSTTIEPPSPLWVTKSSKRLGYTVSYPSDWDVELARKSSGADSYYGLEGEGVIVTRTTKCRCTLNTTTNEVIRYERGHVKGFKVTANTTTRLGGQRARRLESHGTYDGHRSWDLTYLVVRGKYLFIFDYGSDGPLTKADRSTADQIMRSVVFR